MPCAAAAKGSHRQVRCRLFERVISRPKDCGRICRHGMQFAYGVLSHLRQYRIRRHN